MFLQQIKNRQQLSLADQIIVEAAIKQPKQKPNTFDIVLHEVDDTSSAKAKYKYAMIFNDQTQILSFVQELQQSEIAQRRLRIENYIIFENVLLCFLLMQVRISLFVTHLLKFIHGQHPLYVFYFVSTNGSSYKLISKAIQNSQEQPKIFFQFSWLQQRELPEPQKDYQTIPQQLLRERSRSSSSNLEIEIKQKRQKQSKNLSQANKSTRNKFLKKNSLNIDIVKNLNARKIMQELFTYQQQLNDKVKEVENMYEIYFDIIQNAKQAIMATKDPFDKRNLEQALKKFLNNQYFLTQKLWGQILLVFQCITKYHDD